MSQSPDWQGEALERLSHATTNSIVIFRLAPDGGAVIEWANPAAARSFGPDPDVLIGRRVAEIYEAEGTELLRQLRHAHEVGDVTHEIDRELAAGPQTARVQILRLRDDRLAMLSQDMTAERDAGRRAAQVEHIAAVGFYHWNAADDTIDCSDEFCRILGYEPGEVAMTLEKFYSHVHPEDLAEQERLLAHVRDHPGPVTTTFRIRRTDGEVRTIEARTDVGTDERGTLLYERGTVQDRTEYLELQRAAERLRRARARKQTGLEVHDQIVQGLATVWLALELEDRDAAMSAARTATANAQQAVRTLLAGIVDAEGLRPGDLVSGTVAPADPYSPTHVAANG